VTAIESDQGKRIAESLLKVCSGEDTISARFLYSEHFEFKPVLKLWLATNHKPQIVGTDEAIWRRIKLIPFNVTIPQERRDRRLCEKLKGEAPGILNWVLAGHLAWQLHGLGDAKAVRAATDGYRTESDALGHFLEAKTVVERNAEIGEGDLYRAYRCYAEESREYVMNAREFASALTDRGFSRRRISVRADRPAGRYWQGIALVA
jgi:putative DNA primase/helicase